MSTSFVKASSFTLKFCKVVSLVSVLVTVCILLLLSPILFGRHMFSVKQTDCTDYPVNALAYYAYTPAENYFPGDCAAVKTERGLLVLTLTENESESRVWHTAGDFKAYAEVPYEYLEGKVSAFCLPHMGFVADDWPVLLPIFAGGAALFYAFSRVLPKKLYQPKYGRKPGEEAENGADT